MHTFEVRTKQVTVYPARTENAPAVYLNTFAREQEQIWKALSKPDIPDFTLVTITNLDWDHDLAPWDAPSAFAGGTPSTGGAEDYLRLLTAEILPQAEEMLPGTPAWRGIAGYSLAGLFALYALTQTEVFQRGATMSGSLWFPDFGDWLQKRNWTALPRCLYFSLGNKESKVRNPLLRTNLDQTRTLQAFFAGLGVDTTLEIPPGNHYFQTVERTARGIAWILDR